MTGKRGLFRTLGVTAVAGASLLLMVTTSGASSSGTLAKGAPVKIGISLSLSGDFSADGIAFQQGYKLWAADVNKKGGLLGHKVSLDIVSDASSPTQVVTNYQKLISTDKVNLTFGPFSSLLTLPAAKAVSRYGYAMVEGAGGAPSVFQAGLNNVFDVALPVANSLVPFATWLSTLPKSQRPTTVSYVTSDDPFTEPQIPVARAILAPAGIKQVYYKVFPAEATDFSSIADAVASAKAQVVVLGSTDVPTVAAFMLAFQQAHYTPKVFIATAGPDQGAAFTKAVGIKNANGMMVPNSWYGLAANTQSKTMVAEYIKKYGGTPADVNGDVAEAYAVGQVITAAVKATKGFNNAKIIAYLHSGVKLTTVLGHAQFNKLGENPSMTAYTFQWQGAKFLQVNPVADPNSVKILFPKPAWG
ncbi:MAG TPA: amino acid ABC transporter substrate-binding protein [Acidimicrobiales bacterium]